METLEPILREHAFLRGLDPGYLTLLVGCATNVRFGAGEYLFREGDAADHFFLVRDGRVAIEIAGAPRGSIVVETVDPGDVVGFSWLFEPYRYQFDARAVEPTRAIALDGVCLRGKCEEDPSLGYDLTKRFARVFVGRLRATRVQLLDVYGHADAR
jgi:CRP/FNR family cyclic AMP-dependent transcriptional regulator